MKIRRIDFYPDDWIAGTVSLSHEERSVYISICAAIWSRGEGPVDEAFVRKICPGPHFKRALDKLLAKGKVTRIWPETGPKLAQERAENELKRARNRTEISLKNGAKGGRPNGLAKPDGYRRGLSQQSTINNQQPTEGFPPCVPPVGESPPNGEPKHSNRNGVSKNGSGRGTRLPPEWQLSEADREFAIECGLEPDETLPHFCDYWHAKTGSGATKSDWSATWRNWCRRAQNDKSKAEFTFVAKQQHRERVRAAMVRYALERDGD